MPVNREDRLSGNKVRSDDPRSPFQVDRDRLLYSMPFRRLAGVTQVVSPGEGEIFHNRLTHSLKVAQIARRFAEYFCKVHKTEVRKLGGLDPDAAEAAALAHDLGHPPFGHVAEHELNRLINEELRRSEPNTTNRTTQDFEGFEGNAQSFRIITRLAVRRPGSEFALDLTRATLNAALKYPWKWGENTAKLDKYGAYEDDNRAFEFAREETTQNEPATQFRRSLEAQIMDWSDDIAYSIHDTEDFYRAGLIPLDRLERSDERDYFLDSLKERAKRKKSGLTETPNFERIFRGTLSRISIRQPYTGTREQQEYLYNFVSDNIHRYVTATKISLPENNRGEALQYPDEHRIEVAILKELIWTYVIENPSLSAHQQGQRRAIRMLFEEYNQAVIDHRWSLLPAYFSELAQSLHSECVNREETEMSALVRVRLVTDAISSMTDRQALLIYQQFSGMSPSSMLDPVMS